MMNSFQTSRARLNSGESKRTRPERRFSTTEEITINIRTAGKANGLNVAARLTTGVEGLNEGFARPFKTVRVVLKSSAGSEEGFSISQSLSRFRS